MWWHSKGASKVSPGSAACDAWLDTVRKGPSLLPPPSPLLESLKSGLDPSANPEDEPAHGHPDHSTIWVAMSWFVLRQVMAPGARVVGRTA